MTHSWISSFRPAPNFKIISSCLAREEILLSFMTASTFENSSLSTSAVGLRQWVAEAWLQAAVSSISWARLFCADSTCDAKPRPC